MDQDLNVPTAPDVVGVEVESDERDGPDNNENDVTLRQRRSLMWRVFGRRVPKEEIVFGSQMCVVLIVVVASIYNLSVGTGQQSELWTALLSSCLGYILPNPRLKKD